MLLLNFRKTTTNNYRRNEGWQIGVRANNLLCDCCERTKGRIQHYALDFLLQPGVVISVDSLQELQASGSSH